MIGAFPGLEGGGRDDLPGFGPRRSGRLAANGKAARGEDGDSFGTLLCVGALLARYWGVVLGRNPHLRRARVVLEGSMLFVTNQRSPAFGPMPVRRASEVLAVVSRATLIM
jgi:hypothetical protein